MRIKLVVINGSVTGLLLSDSSTRPWGPCSEFRQSSDPQKKPAPFNATAFDCYTTLPTIGRVQGESQLYFNFTVF